MSIDISNLFDYSEVDCSKGSDIHMDVVLTAPQKNDSKRIPLNISLAIDCSGSMSGNKLFSVKSTTLKLIEHLSENDNLSIIGFSDDAFKVLDSLVMNQSNKEIAKKAVQGLQTTGCTNISAALAMASENVLSADKVRVCRVIVLTDGLPNRGISDHEGLVKFIGEMGQRLSVSTFGYGNDYDPELLTSMSSIGRGNHFYIQQDEDCNRAFALELGGLLSLYAQDIRVVIEPSGNMDFKMLSDYKAIQDPGYRLITPATLSYVLDDIYAGEKKHAIIKVHVPQATDTVCARKTNICSITVDYLDTETQKRVEIQATARIQYVKPGKAASEGNIEVRKQLMLIEAAKKQKEAKAKADAGDYAGARVILQGAVDWAKGNAWYENSQVMEQNFQSLMANCQDRYSYHTTGSKMASALYRSYTTSRGSSAGGMAVSYTSAVQTDMLKSFSGGDQVSGSLGIGTNQASIQGVSVGSSTTPDKDALVLNQQAGTAMDLLMKGLKITTPSDSQEEKKA